MTRRPQIEVILADIMTLADLESEPGTIDRVVFCCFDTRATGLHQAAIVERERVSS